VKRRRERPEEASEGPRVRSQEQLLIDAVAELPSGRLLCNTSGRGQFARAFAAASPTHHATCWFLDLYQRDQAEREGVAEGLGLRAKGLGTESAASVSPSALSPQPSAVAYLCAADPPTEQYDVVGWCCSARGDGELTREMLQIGHDRLRMDGRFSAAIDNPKDQWLHEELRKLFSKVTRRPSETGVFYLATKTARLPKLKSYDAEFAFRDEGKLIYACSRPGVFSHRHIDTGARALINTMRVERGMKVLDLGCGTGVVGLAALCRSDKVSVLAVDANPRALQSAERGAKRNELVGLETSLDATGETVPPNAFDLVCANPPYYSHYKIADLFLQIAQQALNLNGVVHVVTKTPDWFVEQMPRYFTDVEPQPVKSYWVVTARRGKR
jgi:16S rRNA (guanine1207-N2)-methyltransferase